MNLDAHRTDGPVTSFATPLQLIRPIISLAPGGILSFREKPKKTKEKKI